MSNLFTWCSLCLHQEKHVRGRLCICFANKSLREEILSKTISLNSTDMFPMFIKTGLKRLSLSYIFNMRWICSFSSGRLEEEDIKSEHSAAGINDDHHRSASGFYLECAFYFIF
jgi:hypothetical protein